MAAIKRVSLKLVLVVSVLIVGAGIGLQQWVQRADPCSREDEQALVKRYPGLKELYTAQQAETEELLREHRRQDVRINLELSGQKIAPEDALRLSMQQIDELAALRKRQRAEFLRQCRARVRASR